jgi:hypothetical protein
MQNIMYQSSINNDIRECAPFQWMIMTPGNEKYVHRAIASFLIKGRSHV